MSTDLDLETVLDTLTRGRTEIEALLRSSGPAEAAVSLAA